MKRRSRVGLIILGVLALVVLRLIGLPRHDVNQTSLNLGLIAAIKRNDTSAALSLLARGADANARDDSIPSRETLWQWAWDRLRGTAPTLPTSPTTRRAPTALFVLIGSHDSTGVDPPDPPVLPENLRLVTALLDRGASVIVRDAQGCTPLCNAAMYSKFRTASLLLERGADVNATDSDGIQPLFWAVILFDEPLAKLLLEHGAQINHRDRSGRTVLWWAVGQPNRQKAEMVRFLLEHRADPSLPDRHGVSPLKRASGEVKIIRLLKQAGAKK